MDLRRGSTEHFDRDGPNALRPHFRSYCYYYYLSSGINIDVMEVTHVVVFAFVIIAVIFFSKGFRVLFLHRTPTLKYYPIFKLGTPSVLNQVIVVANYSINTKI